MRTTNTKPFLLVVFAALMLHAQFVHLVGKAIVKMPSLLSEGIFPAEF